MKPLVGIGVECPGSVLDLRPGKVSLGFALDEAPLKAADLVAVKDRQVITDPATDMAGHPFGDQERSTKSFELVDNPYEAFWAAIGMEADDIGKGECPLVDGMVEGLF